MPVSKEFNNTDQEWHYALSWMACDYIAASHGESRLWELVDAMHNGGQGTSDDEQDRVLVQVLGYDGGRARPPRCGADPQPVRLSHGSPRRAGIPTAVGSVVRTKVGKSDHRSAQMPSHSPEEEPT